MASVKSCDTVFENRKYYNVLQ